MPGLPICTFVLMHALAGIFMALRLQHVSMTLSMTFCLMCPSVQSVRAGMKQGSLKRGTSVATGSYAALGAAAPHFAHVEVRMSMILGC